MSEKIAYTPLGKETPRRKSSKLLKHLAVGALLVFAGYKAFSHISDDEPPINPKESILDTLKINLAGDWLKKYTSEPHLAGTNYGFVEWTAQKFEEYGFTLSIDEYEILVSYPHEQALHLLKSDEVVYTAPLKEDVLEDDKTTQGNDTIPTFLGYAANGNVTAEYIYVNYGTLEDFEKLNKLGVDVNGKIVIARYGAIFRGLKVKFAQEAGAIGILLYSDPGDDNGITPANGYKQYPDGPARQESSVQRGSVQFLGGVGATPGDPTTPGYPSKAGAEREDPHQSIGKIPALAISYREVKPILARLNGHGLKIKEKGWVGELEGFDYSTGPNEKFTLNLYNDQIFKITPLWNVYGEIEGDNKDEVIVIGNHRDAWIKGGAGDPNSGSAVLLEVARALGALKAAGYKFKRSIILQSFDGEEYGLLGSTEQGEYFAKSYQKNVVAYLNLDAAVVGKHIHFSALPTLNHILREAAKEIEYPEEGVGSVYDDWVEQHDGKVGILGSGSDYTVYLEHLGIPSADIGFGPTKGDKLIYHYHSNYDSYHWISKFADPGFVYHNLAAKYLSFLILGLSEHQVINFRLTEYASALKKYYDEATELVPKKWLKQEVTDEDSWDDLLNFDEDVEYINEASSGIYFDESPLPFVDLLKVQRTCHSGQVRGLLNTKHHKNATLHDLIEYTQRDFDRLHNTTVLFDQSTRDLQFQFDHRDSLNFWQKIKLHFRIKVQNKLLKYFERNFLHGKGLHERSWFKHIVFASGRKTGYAAQTLPGLKEAAEDGDFKRFVHWLGIVSRALKRANAQLA